MSLSERHHYLPEFFVKGFVGTDNKVAVFNKTKNRLEQKRKSPRQVFYEWNRNTFEINGERTDVVEKLYQLYENKFAPTYEKLTKNGLEENDIYTYDILQVMLFICSIYRRIPSQDSRIDKYVESLSQKNSIFSIRDKETGENIEKELFDKMLREPFFKESLKIVRSLEDYIKVSEIKGLKNWKLSYTNENNLQPHLLSDNPLIMKESIGKELLGSILIFPLSKGLTVYNTRDKTIKEIPAEHTIDVDLLIFIQGERMVCGPDGSYLKSISEEAKYYNTNRQIELLKKKVFQVFE